MYEEAAPCAGSLCWGSGAVLSGVDWSSVNNPGHPVAYTRGTTMTMVVRMDVTGGALGTATLRVTGPDGITGEGTFTVPCQTTEERFVTITTTALPNVVKAYTPAGLTWSVRCPGDTTFRAAGGTSHRIYVTYGTPSGSNPTNRRLNFVCNAAWQAGTALEVIDGIDPNGISGGLGIHARLDADPPDDGNGGMVVPDWRLMAGLPFTGECDEQAMFMNMTTLIIGMAGGLPYVTWPSRDCDPTQQESATAAQAGITWDIDGDGTIGEEMLVLRFDFDGGAGTNINAFEGSIAYPQIGKYYAVWPSLEATSKCMLLLQLHNTVVPQPVQCWALSDNLWQCIRDPSTGDLVKAEFPVCAPGCP